jgi:hypothetical protein
MRRKHSAVATPDVTIRFAWWAAFFATLTLVAILGLAKSAQALTVPTGESVGTPMALLPTPTLDEELEFEVEAEASEDEEFEFDECEEAEECDGEETGSELPPECLVSSAEAEIFATANRDKVRLQVRYTTTSPTAVSVDYGLHGSKGSLYLGGDKKQFAKKGVLRLTENLTEAQMAKVMAAKAFAVRLRVSAAPHYCESLLDRQLDVRRATPTGLSWQQSE